MFPPLSILLSSFLPSFLLLHFHPFRSRHSSLESRDLFRLVTPPPPLPRSSFFPLPLSSPLPPAPRPSIIDHAFAFALAAEERDAYRGLCREPPAGSGRCSSSTPQDGEIHDAVIREAAAVYTKEANVLIKSPGKRENFAIARRFCDFPKLCQRLASSPPLLPFDQFQGGDRREGGGGGRESGTTTPSSPPFHPFSPSLPFSLAEWQGENKRSGGKNKRKRGGYLAKQIVAFRYYHHYHRCCPSLVVVVVVGEFKSFAREPGDLSLSLFLPLSLRLSVFLTVRRTTILPFSFDGRTKDSSLLERIVQRIRFTAR